MVLLMSHSTHQGAAADWCFLFLLIRQFVGFTMFRSVASLLFLLVLRIVVVFMLMMGEI